MKVAIVGGGTGGVTCAMALVSRSHEWIKVDIIHDPTVPIFGVGESLGHDFVQLIRGATQFSFPFDLEKLNAKIKQGIMFVDWQQSQNYPDSTNGYMTLSCQALHADTFALRDFVLPRMAHYWSHKFKEIHGHVDRIWQDEYKAYIQLGEKALEYDFVIDARGIPKSVDDTFEYVDSIPVDSAVLNMCPHPGDWDFTYSLR